MLVGQAKAEAVRHEQKRAQLAEKLSSRRGRAEGVRRLGAAGHADPAIRADGGAGRRPRGQASRARPPSRRHRVARRTRSTPCRARPLAEDAAAGADAASASLSRVVMSAQEDLRRDIARAMHDGPAQSLTNIVLQAAIVERLMDREPDSAKGELRLLVSMVQQTLDATKNFIFDVRPMVLDDLGVVPTLRRMARDRGRRAQDPGGVRLARPGPTAADGHGEHGLPDPRRGAGGLSRARPRSGRSCTSTGPTSSRRA